VAVRSLDGAAVPEFFEQVAGQGQMHRDFYGTRAAGRTRWGFGLVALL
jgi:hypothetical protein